MLVNPRLEYNQMSFSTHISADVMAKHTIFWTIVGSYRHLNEDLIEEEPLERDDRHCVEWLRDWLCLTSSYDVSRG